MALHNCEELTVVPSLTIELPFKKKGPSYRSDFVIMTEQSESAKMEQSGSNNPDSVIFKEALPIMIIEVKTTIPIEFYKVKADECIEMLVYCFYIMRLYKREVVLGSLTDGKVWHTLKLTKKDDGLVVEDYYILESTEDHIM